MQEAAKASDAFTAARRLIQKYFDSWKGTDADTILAWYSNDVTLWLPTGLLKGKTAVRDQFVLPFITAFPGNVHEIQRLVCGDKVVAVEWRFKAEHSGGFQGIPASGYRTDVPGCSFYSLENGVITTGNIYFNFATLLEQISVSLKGGHRNERIRG